MTKSSLVLSFKKELLAFFCVFPFSAKSAVISLNLCTDQLLVQLAPEQITALEPLARDPALSFVASQASSLPQVRADAEAVLRLHPQLVLAGRYGAQSTVALLKARGVRVVQLGEAQDFEQIAAQTVELATLLGVRPRGQALVARMWARLAAVQPQHGTAVLWQAAGWTAGPGSLGDAVLRAAGYTNLGTGGRIGVEALLARKPDVLVTEAAARAPSMATDLAWHPALQNIPRRTIAPALLICGGPQSAVAVEALAK